MELRLERQLLPAKIARSHDDTGRGVNNSRYRDAHSDYIPQREVRYAQRLTGGLGNAVELARHHTMRVRDPATQAPLDVKNPGAHLRATHIHADPDRKSTRLNSSH